MLCLFSMPMILWKEIWDWSNCSYAENKSQAHCWALSYLQLRVRNRKKDFTSYLWQKESSQLCQKALELLPGLAISSAVSYWLFIDCKVASGFLALHVLSTLNISQKNFSKNWQCHSFFFHSPTKYNIIHWIKMTDISQVATSKILESPNTLT